MSADFRFPESLKRPPRPFVGLTGLDTTHNAIHRTIWEAFEASKKEDRKRLAYKLFELDHIYPKPSRPDFVRMNYESYTPAGILKRSWMKKHTTEIPSVLIVFFDLDWKDPEWDNKKLECASRVEIVRSGLQKRATYLVVVLVQSTPPNLPGTVNTTEEQFVRDRASQLYKACSLVQGQLYLLPVLGRLETTARYVSQLEDAIFTTAQKYYDQRIKKIKGHEDLLLLPQHNLLMVRYHFKTAFFTELRQDKLDMDKALEDYRKAYQLIVDTVSTMADHILEFKVVSGYCSYKICNILFRKSDVEGALMQFRRHIDFFRSQIGPKSLAYEHASWMSKQYSGFADLLSSIISNVKATQRSHPGVYYQKAAFYAIDRQRLCHTLCTKSAQLFAKELPPLPEADYVGQRPWRKGLVDVHPSSPKIEHEDVAVMQVHEYKVEHAWQIIPLLSLATEHFKKYHSERTIVSLKVKMAEQYYQLGEYDKCLILLLTAAQTYRADSWWSLLSSVLQLSLRCAYLLGKVDEYVSIACELIAHPIPLVNEEKIRIQGNLNRVLKGGVPDQEAGCKPASLQLAEENWSCLQESHDNQILTVLASDIACYVECRGGFVQSATNDGEITVKVFLRCTAPLDTIFSHLMVHFNFNEYDSFAVSKTTEKIELITGQVKEFEFHILPLAEHVWERLEILSIDLVHHQGVDGSLKIFRWNGTGGDYGVMMDSDQVIGNTMLTQTCYLTPRTGKLGCSTHHSGKILDGEIFPLKLCLENNEESSICNVEVSFFLLEDKNLSQANELFQSIPCDEPDETADPNTKVVLNLDSLETGDKSEMTVYGRFRGQGMRKFCIRILYSIPVLSGLSQVPCLCRCMKEEILNIPVVHPFTFGLTLKNMKLERLDNVLLDQPFLLVCVLSSRSPFPIKILDIQYDKPSIVSICGPVPAIFSNQVLQQEGDVSQHCYCLSVPSEEEMRTSLSLGKINITWKRHPGTEDLPAMTVTEVLPTVAVQNMPFILECDIPCCGRVNTLMPMSFTFKNKSQIVQEYEIKMIQDEDTHFKVAGNQMHHFRVVPGGLYCIRYNLFPTEAGHVSLPIFHMTYCRDPKAYDAFLRHQIPTHIEILPSDKRNKLIEIN